MIDESAYNPESGRMRVKKIVLIRYNLRFIYII